MIMPIIFILASSLLFSHFWGYLVISMTVLTLLCLINLNQYFTYSLNLGVMSNSLSNLMVVLVIYLMLLVFLATKKMSSLSYNSALMILTIFLVMTFSTSNFFYFYMFFEASLIPTLALIIGWGYQPERLQAGTYMMLYTVLASLPLLIMILYLFNLYNTSEFYLLEMLKKETLNWFMVFFLLLAFLVKLPIYSCHLWLPKAHVEAPLAGSMILAGILLKLGGYGLSKMSITLSIESMSVLNAFIFSLSIWGAVLASLMCLRQVDVKSLVAYSSVGHMSVVIMGTIYGTNSSLFAAVTTMFAHAFSSSALFCLAYYSYEKISSRSMLYMKGLLVMFPMLSMLWFVFTCVNMAAPPSLNLIGEMMIIPMLSSLGFLFLLMMGFCVFLSASYNMFLYTSINHGKASEFLLGGNQLHSNQLLVLVMHLVPLLLMFNLNLFCFAVIMFY